MAGGAFYRTAARKRRIRNNRVKSAAARADASECMLLPVPPMSNNERQRRFHAAQPGNDRRRKARERSI
jgi:hypothetical protein